jgi:hypothetical protein
VGLINKNLKGIYKRRVALIIVTNTLFRFKFPLLIQAIWIQHKQPCHPISFSYEQKMFQMGWVFMVDDSFHDNKTSNLTDCV